MSYNYIIVLAAAVFGNTAVVGIVAIVAREVNDSAS